MPRADLSTGMGPVSSAMDSDGVVEGFHRCRRGLQTDVVLAEKEALSTGGVSRLTSGSQPYVERRRGRSF